MASRYRNDRTTEWKDRPIECELYLEMRLKLKIDEATKSYYLHLIVVHAKSNQTKHHEKTDNIDC